MIKDTAKKVLPETISRALRRYRSYTAKELALYLRIRLLDGQGSARTRLRINHARSFLFVCYGNIMRSPMCEALMKRALPDMSGLGISVASAGLHAVPGRAAHPWAIAAAREFGICLDSHHAKALSAEMVEQAEVIFVMDYQNQVQLLTRHSHAANRVSLLSAYAGEGYGSVEIPDPYYFDENATRQCYATLNHCIQNLVKSIS